MQRLNRTPRHTPRGFSITELLASIGIIGLLLAITFPVISVMTSSGRVEAGLNIVGMSSDVARQWVHAEAWANDASATAPILEEYSGTAALYCPTGEIRIVVNDRNARDTSISPSHLEDRNENRNGYKDLDKVDYIRIPSGVGVVGIQRTGSGATAVRFIAPPFAIAYNEAGQLHYGDDRGTIYYDADANGSYSINQDRPNSYNPFQWRGYDSATNATPMSGSLKKRLPFEAIECVPGVVIFSQYDFDKAGFDFAGGGHVTLASNEGQWLQENGKTIFFSPHTGVALTEEEQD